LQVIAPTVAHIVTLERQHPFDTDMLARSWALPLSSDLCILYKGSPEETSHVHSFFVPLREPWALEGLLRAHTGAILLRCPPFSYSLPILSNINIILIDPCSMSNTSHSNSSKLGPSWLARMQSRLALCLSLLPEN